MNNLIINNELNKEILEIIVQGLSAGLNYSQLLKYLSGEIKKKKIPEISEPELGEYLIEAYKYFYQKSEIDKKYQAGLAIERLNNLYMNCYKIQDYKTCFQIQKEINVILEKKQKEIDDKTENYPNNEKLNIKLDLTKIQDENYQ